MKLFPLLASVWIAASSVGAAAADAQYTILHGVEAEKALQQCSRPAIDGITGYWDPSQQAIRQLESDIPRLKQLAIRQDMDKFIGNPEASHRQYVGVVIGGQRYIYINAWSANEVMLGSSGAWRFKAFVVCDGGPSHWGALYDPQTGKFSALTGNGVA